MLDFSRAGLHDDAFLHLTSPHPVPWKFIIEVVANKIDLPIIPYNDWLEKYRTRVHELSAKQEHDRAFNLLDFFENFDSHGLTHIALRTEKSQKASKTLANLQPIRSEEISKYVDYWRKEGLLGASV